MERENLVHTVETERTRDGDYKITLRGLTEEDKQRLERMLLGLAWGRVNNERRIEIAPALNGVPGPIDDDLMLPFWRQANTQELRNTAATALKQKPGKLPEGGDGIVVEHLCGYDWTPELYREVVRRLESYGFECLRSRRDPGGRFREIWYLCGLFAAKGALKDATEHLNDKEHRMKVAINFLCRTTSFGSLSVMAQRAFMPVDD